jgi:uncharacterized protein (DUF58 family)
VVRAYSMAGLLVMVSLAGALGACGSSNAARSAPGLRCTNYALQGTGAYHNEVSVQVDVSNSTTHPARYAVRVDLTTSGDRPGSVPSVHVTINGSVASRASAVLARKVLTADRVQGCRVTRIIRLGRS